MSETPAIAVVTVNANRISDKAIILTFLFLFGQRQS